MRTERVVYFVTTTSAMLLPPCKYIVVTGTYPISEQSSGRGIIPVSAPTVVDATVVPIVTSMYDSFSSLPYYYLTNSPTARYCMMMSHLLVCTGLPST